MRTAAFPWQGTSIAWRKASLLFIATALLVWLIAHSVAARLNSAVTPEMVQAGRELFVHEWIVADPRAHGDGLGPVFNANSCAACHFQGGLGGGGDSAHNVTAYEVHPNIRDRKVQNGLVHAFAVNPSYAENQAVLKTCFPIIPGGDRVVGNCTVKFEDFDPVRIESTNSIALFGDGLIDRIPESAIRLNHARRTAAQIGREMGGDFDTSGAGRPRVLASGRVGKFGWKGQFASLREFVAAACANELGLGNPLMEQATPLRSNHIKGEADLNRQEFRQLVAFVNAIPRPVEVLPPDPREHALAVRGKSLFSSIGCADCHTPDLGAVAGIYSDLLLHSLTTHLSDGYTHEIIVEVPLPGTHPKPDEWKTPPLWGVADSAPYFHDGASPTLLDAILRHEGDAIAVTKAYKNLPTPDQQAVVAFLKTLQAPPAAVPVKSLLAANAAKASR
jgi:CxxC motif-containing protein (DUF1111 family)